MTQLQESLETKQVSIYLVSIIAGLLIGLSTDSFYTSSFGKAVNPALAIMLFATFLQLPIINIKNSLRNIGFISALSVSNFIFIPLLVTALSFLLPDNPMLQLAVLLVLLSPCIDYVITFTHLAKGNARLLLILTPYLLLAQMILLPVFINAIMGGQAHTLIEAKPFVKALIWLIAVPLLLALVVQKLSKDRERISIVVHRLGALTVPSTAVVLFLVVASVAPHIAQAKSTVLTAAPVSILFALLAPIVGAFTARLFSLNKENTRAIQFSSSYRNSLVILPLALAIPGGVPLIPSVILTQTITELCFLPVYMWWARQ